MKILTFILFFTIGCTPVFNQSCEFCGEWIYDRFENVGRVTTDCEDVLEYFKNSRVILNRKEFSKTYYIDNYPTQANDPDIEMRPAKYLEEYDDPNIQELIIKKDGKTIENFYFLAPYTFYNTRDGCRFYFKRKSK